MNAAILQRLIWKEYRVLRSFWLATLLLTVCAAIAWRGLADWYERPVHVEDFFVLAAMITSLFALGAGGTAFATEHEVGTAEFLRRLPLDARNLCCGKFALAFVSVIGMKAVLWSAASILLLMVPVHGDQLRTIWWCSWVSELELFAWAALMSLLTRQPLMAITWAVTVASIIVHLVLPFLWPELRGDAQYVQGGLLTDYDFALPGRAVFALGLLALTATLSTKWLSSPQPLSLLPDWWRQRSLRRRVDQQSWLVEPAMRQSSRATANGQLTRMIWLQWRLSRWWWASLAIPFVLFSVWRMVLAPVRNDDLNVAFNVSTGLFWFGLGVGVFHRQQAQCRFRYFAEHGVSPALVWWGHQLAPLALLVFSVALTFVVTAVAYGFPVEGPSVAFEAAGGLLLLASILFATGQLAGILFRQPLVAGAMGLIVLVMHLLWFRLLYLAVAVKPFDVVLTVIGLAPLPLAWFTISHRYTANWLLERRSGAVRLRLGLAIVAPWLLMAMGLMAYRVLKIPNVGVEPPTREELLKLTDEERETAELYQAAVESLPSNVEGMPEGWWRTNSRIKETMWMKAIEARLHESEEPLKRILAATRRPVGAFAGEPDKQNDDALLLLTTLDFARERAVGDLDKALELDEATRQLIHQWRRNTDFRGLGMSNIFESRLDTGLRNLLGTVAWKPEQYRECSRRVSASPGPLQAGRAVDWAYREALDEFRGEWHRPTRIGFLGDHNGSVPPSRWWLWIPGEETRTVRIVTANYRSNRIAPHFAIGADNPYPYGYERNTPWAHWLMSEIRWQSYEASSNDPAATRRVLQALLALHARKAELGHWPESADGIPGLGTDGGVKIEYLPRGVWGGPAPQILRTRESHGNPINLRGDEPCLVWLYGSIKPNLPTDLVNAPTANDRARLLEECLVIPLDPLPPESD